MSILKKRGKTIGYYACLLLAMLLWWETIKSAGQIREGCRAVSLRYDKAGISVRQTEEAVKEDTENGVAFIPSITLWDVKGEVSISEPALGRQTQAGLYEAAGDMEQVVPYRWLYGGAVSRNDPYGCVIDKATAYELFGAHSVEGKTISLNGRDYIVRGILNTGKKIVMLQSADEERLFPNAELIYTDTGKEEKGTLAGQFISRHSLGTPVLLLDGGLFSGFAHVVSLLPACLLGLLSWAAFALWLARVKVNAKKARPLVLAGKIILGALTAVFFLWLCAPSVRLPDSFIPTRWSDFSFYSAKYTEIMGQMEQFFSSRLMVKDVWMAGRLLLCILFSSYAMPAVVLFFSLTGRRQAEGHKLAWDITATVLCAFFLILQAYGDGSMGKLPLSFPSVFLAVILIKRLTARYRAGFRHVPV